ncbi:MAG: hypothetical protein SGPRY_012443, partial [Prymnesium sp.]
MQAGEECPVCLEEWVETIRIPCHHSICRQCALQLYEVQTAGGAASRLTCPLCRVVHTVAQGIDLFLQEAADRELRCSNSSGRGSHATARRKDSAFADLTPEELRAILVALGAHGAKGGREELARALRDVLKLEAEAEGGEALTKLPSKALIALLRHRKIPYDDCVEKNELVSRAAVTSRGSCMQLPPKVLKQMLAGLGLSREVYVDKANLARRVMAARALSQMKAEIHGCTPSGYCCASQAAQPSQPQPSSGQANHNVNRSQRASAHSGGTTTDAPFSQSIVQ